VQLLDGVWNTANIEDADALSSFDSLDPSFHPRSISTNATTNIPSCVDRSPPGYLVYRGVSFFRRRFYFDLSISGARIQFQACSFYCRVWVNGNEIGDHRAGGYVAFFLDIPAQNSTDNEIFVLTDFRFNKTTAPLHTGGDFYHYGGIMRSVELHALPRPIKINDIDPQQEFLTWPWRLYVTPDSLQTVQVTLHLTANRYIGSVVSSIFIAFDDGPFREYPPGSFYAIDGVADLGTLDVPNPRVWSTIDPQLHVIKIKMDGAILIERFGLRIFDTDPDKLRFRLNGEVIKLVGWSHHTQFPDTAGSPTDDQLDDDLELLKEGGANYVRGAHYPQDPRWLDRLDENGMVMWCEALGPDVTVSETQSAYFLKYQAQQVNEMLDNAMNHASVAIWAFFNEGPSDRFPACPAYEMCAGIIKSRDKSRFVSYASDKNPPNDKCFHVVDVMAMNSYPGWYQKQIIPESFWSTCASFYISAGKPFLISEAGAAGIYEWSDNQTAVPWTSMFQINVLVENINVAISDHNISGVTLWHFFDFKTKDAYENNTHCEYLPNVIPPTCSYIAVNISERNTRPGGANHKGVLDFWRRKKPSFEEVSRRYRSMTRKPAISVTDERIRRRQQAETRVG
jgi:beta-glucuronidase